MRFALTDILPLVFILVSVLTSKLQRTESEELISRSNTGILKGILCLFVMFCHLSFYVNEGIVLPLFFELGYIAVGIFFFLSGYGLMKQHMRKEDYHKGFLGRRFVKVLYPYIFVTFVYWLYYLVTDRRIPLPEIFTSIGVGDPIVSYSWYIVEILIIYLLFYLTILIFRKKYLYVLFGNIVLTVFLVYGFQKLDFRAAWFSSTYMYAVGICGALFEKQIVKALNSYPLPFLSFSLFGFLFTFRMEGMDVIRELCFLIFVMCFLHMFEMKNRFLEFMGKISMEVYLIHGLIIKAVRFFISEQGGLFELSLMSILIILSAYVLKTLFDCFFSLIKKK